MLITMYCSLSSQVYDANTGSMVLNITTNRPTFYIRGLNSGTEYFVEIYAANSRGRSDKTLFETFTLQVQRINVVDK
jgi:hypothetical protein